MPTPSADMTMGTPAPAFDLPDPKGRRHASKDFAGAPALLVMFICNHCPYVKHLKKALVDFATKYQARGLAMVAINANDWSRYADDSPEKMQADIDTYGYPFPYLVDESQAVAKAYGAACTPEFYLFDSGRKLFYHGRFDDSTPGNGRPITGQDLSMAVEAALAGEPYPREQSPAMGCSIKWR
ncbi:thioredoxin family protein [Dongia deserti]|uniref:thioredoxin family protein n=1 Tax=Dongia deserti TaxID=2268030 RepID=UPI000E65B8A1|nr:thioredoxin family protein [Dongia deserti]